MKTKILLIISLLFTMNSRVFGANPLRNNLIIAGNKHNALMIYQSYSNQQKAAVWIDKINQVISLNCWNNIQLSYLNNLLGQINSQIFDPTSQSFINFNGFIQTWQQQALSQFNKIQLRFIVTTISDYNPNDIPNPGDDNGQDCNCSLDSDWCGGTLIPGENCKKLLCTQKEGCGTFWLHKCTGVCSGAQPMNINGGVQW
jgi:hypothetical protein